MGTEMGEDLAAHEARVSRLMDRLEALKTADGGNSNRNAASVTFNMGGWLATGLCMLGLVAIGLGWHLSTVGEIRNQAAMDLMAAERRADMKAIESVRQELAAVRDQGSVTNAYALKHEGDIAKLKAGVK